MGATQDVSALRAMLAGLEAERLPEGASFFDLGAPGADGALGGPLACAALHEVFAPTEADRPAATGFTLAMALRAALARGGEARPILWVRQDFIDAEAGRPSATGLAALGLEPTCLLLVRVSDAEAVLKVAGDAARCAALGAVLVEPWGEPKALDLTATRRLSLRVENSGVPLFLLRGAARAAPSAAATRWQVNATPSRPLAGDAPGAPSFIVSLLRHRAGRPGASWHLEWDHETRAFRDVLPLSRSVVPVPAGRTLGDRSAEAGRTALTIRRAS